KHYQPNKTYEQYRAAGTEALAKAVKTRESYGIEAALNHYREAATQFLGAIGSQPLVEGKVPETDPLLLLEYGTCLARLAQGPLRPYSDEQSAWRSRRDDMTRIASETIHRAWDSIKTTSHPLDEPVVPAAIVAADSLEVVAPNEAKEVLQEARVIIANEDKHA